MEVTIADLNAAGAAVLPGHLGVEIDEAESGRVTSHMDVRQHHMAPHGYLHAASVIALADTSCGYGCMLSLPEGGTGFTTIELKANFLGTTRDGTLTCIAKPAHLGRTTQVWDATVTRHDDGGTIAIFRCTQMVLWPKT